MTEWIVSVKPANPATDGPHLVSDHPAVVRAVIEAIGRQFMPPGEDCVTGAKLRALPTTESEKSGDVA